MGSVARRLAQLEMQSFAIQPCRWCEQSYWTLVSTNRAIGPYCETEYGKEVGLVTVRELNELFRASGDAREHDLDYLDHLPAYDALAEEHEGVVAAWDRVVESRPPMAGCECFESWTVVRSVEARVLYHYPRVAEAMMEELDQYAASPFETRALYHYFGAGNKECSCDPRGTGGAT